MRIVQRRGVLHTNSAYYYGIGTGIDWGIEKIQHFSELDIKVSFDEAYEYAQGEELKFYHSYFPDVNTYEAFIAKMRSLFNKAGDDGARIKKLSNINLNQVMPNPKIKTSIQYQLTITGDLCNEISLKSLNSDNVRVEEDAIYVNLNLRTVQPIKEAINKDLGYNRYNRFNDEFSTNMRNIKQWFNTVATQNEVATQLTNNITITKRPVSEKERIISDELEGFLFAQNMSKEQRLACMNGDYGKEAQHQFKQEMGQALKKIKDFIFNSCLQVENGTQYGVNKINILKESAIEVWREILGEDIYFFFEGDNLYKSVLGKIGEFQLALKDRYIRMVLSQTNPKIGHIIGNIISDDKRLEPRSDYQLILDLGGDIGDTIIGIQSKNIGNSSMQEVKINTDLGLVAPNLGYNFVDAITNSYFNTSIEAEVGDMTNYLTEYLNTYFWKAMNLNIGTNLDPKHTNTFYWTGGTALVPASRIIETLNRELITSPQFDITKASWNALSDEGFNNANSDGKPIFTDYWHGSHGHWNIIDNNTKIYQQLLDNTRIHTHFSIARIFTANGGRFNFEFLDG